MVNVILTVTNITIMDDGNYSVQVTPSIGGTYTVKLTPAQCTDLLTLQATINSIAQPLKYIGQQIAITL